MKAILCKDLCNDCKNEFAQKYNLNYDLMTSDQLLDENGIAIFPKQTDSELQQTVEQLTAHLAKMTEQLNLLTLQVQSNQK
jgi:hypothetical protein